MKKITTLKDALVYELRGLYESEKKLLKFLSRYEGLVSSPSLRRALTVYQQNADSRFNKLKWAFQYLDQKLSARPAKAIAALLGENEEILEGTDKEKLRDALLVGCVQRLLHLQISAYGTCQAFAHQLRLHDVEEILKEMLSLEKQMDLKLSILATREINDDAFAAELK